MFSKKFPKPNDIVTVVDNETGEEVTGRIKVFQPNYIVIEKEFRFDAKKVHFKDPVK